MIVAVLAVAAGVALPFVWPESDRPGRSVGAGTSDGVSQAGPADPALPPCAAMTDSRNATITRSCRIEQDVTAGDVVIGGGATVSVTDKPRTLRVRSLMVKDGARFLAGCPRPFTSTLRIVVTDTNRNRQLQGMGAGLVGGMGGDFCLVGSYRGPGFSPLAATVRAGATSVTTKQPLGVAPGQRVVLATTDRNPDHSEVVTVTAVSGNGRTLSVRPAVRSQHLCTTRSYSGNRSITMCGDVAALDRNVEVSPARGAVGHMMFMGGGTVQVAGVHLDGMGYKKARYGGVHFHVKRAAPSSFMARNVCTNARARCYVMHATDDSFMVDNVAFNTTCSAILAGEDGVETGNVYRHNLALNTRPCGMEDFDGIGPDGIAHGPSGIWSAAADQSFYDNHVAGNIGFGFHLDAARFTRPRGLSAHVRANPSAAHVKAFVGFTAYSIRQYPNVHQCHDNQCGSGLMVDVDGRVNGCWPDQRNRAWRCGARDASYPYYAFGRNNMFHDVTVWNADGAAVWGTRGVGFRHLAASDTRDGAWLGDGHIDQGLIVGTSGAVANPPTSMQCTRIYDFKFVVTDTTFANCGTDRGRGGAIDTNGGLSDSHNSGVSAFKGITLDHSNPFFAHGGNPTNDLSAKCEEGHGTIAWLVDDSTGYGPGHLQFPCGPSAGVTRPGWNGVKVVPGRPLKAVYFNQTEQHADPRVVGIPSLPAAPAVPPPALPALIGSGSGAAFTAGAHQH